MTIKTSGTEALWAFEEHEHHDLVHGISRIHEVACEIGRRSTPELSVRVLEILHWLDETLEPHVAWEEGWLYPEIDARTGTPWATRGARFDHQQIREVALSLHADQQLLSRRAEGEPQVEMRCHLFGLEALLRAHIEREERFLIPILDGELPVATG